MSWTTRFVSKASAAALGLALMGIFSAATQAASINYGNFGPVPPGITFIGVTESSGTDPVPLYGPPTPFSVGLDFDPIGFTAFASGGAADLTDGQLNLTLAGNGPKGVGALSLFEAGDYTIAGGGTPATGVTAGAIVRVTVTQVNNLPVVPFNLAPVSASFGDSLPGPVIAAPWSLGLFVDIGAQVLAQGFPAGSAATRVEVVINNALVATSEPASLAFIAKKEFRLDLVPVDVLPEPGSMALAGLALCGLGLAGRKRG